MLPTLASRDDAKDKFNIVNRNRNITKKIVQAAEQKGCKALFIIVDAPQLGRHEKDMLVKFVHVLMVRSV
jgi:isopentenyl diphosphate isomerase/L-lactate dehydrogenase-like FMN-dependent dehydrogenase